MAALLIMMSVMAIGLSMLLPAWSTMAKRERESELIFRGQQYARAVALYQRARGAFPPSIDVLVNEKFLRKKYKDPMTEDGEFQVIGVGMPIPGQVTPPPVAPGRGGAPGTVAPGIGGGAARGGPGAGGLGGGGLGGGGLGAGGLGAGRGPDPSAGRGTAPTLGSGIGAGTPAAASGFNRVTRPGTGVTGPVLGVVSKSEATGLRLFNGRDKYNEWAFVATEANAAAGAAGGTAVPGGAGAQVPGMGGRGRGQGAPGMPGGPGGFGGSRGMPRGSGAAPLQLPGAGAGRGGSPFTVP